MRGSPDQTCDEATKPRGCLPHTVQGTTTTGGPVHTEYANRSIGVVDEDALARTVDRLRGAGVGLPTLAQLANPALVPAGVREALVDVGPDEAAPLNLFRVHWHNGANRVDTVDVP